MNFRLVCSALVVLALVCTAPVARAQRSILPMGAPIQPMVHPIQPMVNPILPMTNPVPPMGSSPVTGFGVMPTPFVSTPPVSVPIPQFVLRPTPAPGPHQAVGTTVVIVNGGTVITSGPVIVAPGTVIVNNATAQRGGTRHTTNTRSGNTAARAPTANKTQTPGKETFSLGTSRSQVLRQMGNPLSATSTLYGETLYFSGGVTVFIQNGVVAQPRR